jgi:O-antigen/teichoic acid export membrane protein
MMSTEPAAGGSRSSTILRNVLANWIGFAVNAGVTLLLTPFVLHHLGAAKYGVWVLTSSVIGYYGLLDLGFRGGVTQYLTRYLAVGDKLKASECISSAVTALSVVGVVLVLLSGVMAEVAPHIFNLPKEIEPEAFWCILIVGCASALQFVFFPFTAVFTAKQRFDLANFIGIGTRLLTAACIYVALTRGYGLIGVSAATCGASAVDYLIRWRVARHIAPELTISPKLANKVRLKEILSFGTWNFQVSVASFAELHLQTLIISFMMPIAAAGHYALATGLVFQISAVLGPIGQVMYPAAAELHARGEHRNLERLYRDGSRLVILAAVTVILIASFWAEDFYRLWIGESYVSGAPFPSVATLLRILLVGTLCSYTASLAGQTLLATGRVRLLAGSLIAGTALNLTLMLIVIKPFGLMGVASAAAIASIVISLILLPSALQKVVDFRVRAAFLGAIVRPIGVAAILTVGILAIRSTGPAQDWSHLIVHGVLAGLIAGGAVLSVGVSSTEREQFLLAPVRRVLRRFFPAPAK